jgi:K319-like protein
MRSRPRSLMLTMIIGLVSWASVGPNAQVTALQTVSPFDIVGFIEAATMTPAADGFSGGGTITVNGTVITVPTNTLLQMPAFALTWQEVFQQAPAPYGPTQSGLAMADLPTPMTTYEVHIQGNRVINATADQYIAGLMFISQQSLNAGAGFINFIDYSKAEMRVGGTIGNPTTGARVRINDPLGKFGPASHVDDRFTIDEDNPTVRSETGYPMCIPRSDPTAADDPLCPQINRPKGSDGNYLTIFTMDQPDFPGRVIDPNATCTTASIGSQPCNPLLMMPFEVGDYITYNGNLVADAAGTYVNSWGVIANVSVLTAPGTQPAYTAIDVMLLGTGGIPDPLLPQEAAVRTRMEGFTTDPTSFVDLFATDVDACTGDQTLRYYATIGVDHLVVLGRWRWRPNTDLAFLPPSRMLTAISENGEYFDPNTGAPGTPNGLRAGFYTAPNFNFIFPENLGIGKPPVPNNLQDFPFLSSGSGLYPAPGPGALGMLGQLSPWPGAVAPQTPVCAGPGGTAAFSPIADAGITQTVKPFATVTLDGNNSRDTTQPLPLPLTFSWAQDPLAGGARVALIGANTATPTFTAPGVPDTLTFILTVSNGVLSSSAKVQVVVTNTPTATDTVTITGATFRIRRAELTVTASTTNAAAVLTVEGFGDMGPALPLAPGVPAPLTDRLYRQVGVTPTPLTVTVRSSLGGIATLPVTVR